MQRKPCQHGKKLRLQQKSVGTESENDFLKAKAKNETIE